ncbi:MAG: serine hydrolase [Variovorax sp.]|nr:MAG: serine hydrolase [Variovorax sp.]
MHRLALCCRALSLCLLLLPAAELARSADWQDALRAQIERIDRDTPGELGVYVKRLDTGETFGHAADQPWYLASTAKVPIGLAVLQQVDAGQLTLARTLVLRDVDKVDGSGSLVWQKNGSAHSVDSLLRRMLGDSDNTAANLLIRTVGEDALNQSAKAAMGGKDFAGFTSFAQVRRDVYAELHPAARKLTNDQLVRVASAPLGPRRVEAVRRAMGVKAGDLQVRTIDEAYARYYKHQRNSATLEAYGTLLEQLVRGKLLSPASTQRLFTAMKFGPPGGYRLAGGLRQDVKFIHKTGTQYRTACHVGVVNPQDGGAKAIVVASCARDLDDQREAGKVFTEVGRAVNRVLLGG